jgi:raffinose/stachyose/melibiose transport system permease protein
MIPVFIAVYFSFTNFTGVGKLFYVQFANYISLFRDKIFFIALRNTFVILLTTILILVPSAFILSLLLNRNLPGGGFAKAVNFTPNIISPILVGLIWVFILDPNIGLLNNVLEKIGLPGMKAEWIGGSTLTPYSVTLVFTWQKLGYYATIFLAGLKGVPDELYEAANIDGAGYFQTLFRIVLPQISGTFVVVFLLIITGCFKIFELVYQMTNGGPNHLSDTLVTYMYYTTFTSSRYGYGMSIATMTFLITVVFSVVYISLTREKLGEEQ